MTIHIEILYNQDFKNYDSSANKYHLNNINRINGAPK